MNRKKYKVGTERYTVYALSDFKVHATSLKYKCPKCASTHTESVWRFVQYGIERQCEGEGVVCHECALKYCHVTLWVDGNPDALDNFKIGVAK